MQESIVTSAPPSQPQIEVLHEKPQSTADTLLPEMKTSKISHFGIMRRISPLSSL